MKLTNYIIILVTLQLFLELLGIPTGLSLISSAFGWEVNPTTSELINSDIEGGTFFDKIFSDTNGALKLLVGAGVILAGFFARSFDVSLLIVAPIIFVVTTLVGTTYALTKYVSTFGEVWLTNLIGLIMIPIGIGLIWSAIGYFGGRD